VGAVTFVGAGDLMQGGLSRSEGEFAVGFVGLAGDRFQRAGGRLGATVVAVEIDRSSREARALLGSVFDLDAAGDRRVGQNFDRGAPQRGGGRIEDELVGADIRRS
jgi:hypothetical protein